MASNSTQKNCPTFKFQCPHIKFQTISLLDDACSNFAFLLFEVILNESLIRIDIIKKQIKKREKEDQNMRKQTNILAKILTLCHLLVLTSPSMSCFSKRYVPTIMSNIQTDKNQQLEIRLIDKSQLRSYHPHYLISYSYPHPITPHIYFGEVVGPQPLFSIKYLDVWDPSINQKLSVNDIQILNPSTKSFALKRQQVFRYMLVVQIENSYEQIIGYHMNVLRRKDHFLIICQYQDKFNAFILYLTHMDFILNLNRDQLKGIRLNIRNESNGDAKKNWKYSQNIFWRGFDNIYNEQSTSYTGLIIQLQFTDHSLKKGLKINLHQIQSDKRLNFEQFVRIQEKIDLQNFVPKKKNKIVRNKNCSSAATQKIFDGLSYEYGSLKIKNNLQPIPNLPKALLSFSPSRKRFPWGFLWDDGFHCEVAVRKDQKLTLKVIQSWLDTMLDNGWIPREQNRGEEREKLCSCPRFMEKDMRDGNPPTLILALEYLRRNNKLNPTVFPQQYWSKLKKWYDWFIQTQKDEPGFLFKWKDSINQAGASFTSGMDDFPRPLNTKANIDLQSWIYFFTKFMLEASHLYSDSNVQYISSLELLKSNFKFFIENTTKLYKDISFDGSHSQHFGYPSILPIAFGIPEYKSPQYDATIQMIKSHLDTGAGISSISKYSMHYLKTPDAYWKGPVWINLNYMLLRGLKLYYPRQSEFYNKIRNDLLRTVCDNWQNNGYFYQNYIQGIGSFSYPFNGWTSLISIISEENY